MNERFVVLGIAPPRREWFRRVGRWANEAALPVEFVKCISVDEVQSRLESGRPFSALLIDASTNGLDRDLLELASSLGCSPLIVDHGLVDRDWEQLGARAVLPERFEVTDLSSVLDEHAASIARASGSDAGPEPALDNASARHNRTIAVTGAGGMGTSTIAMAVAQGLVRENPERSPLLLTDMALRSGQAMLHDTRDVVPGLLEFIDGHRLGVPNIEETRTSIHTFPERGYDLLLGLRSERDWVSISGRALSAAWSTMTDNYRTVVCDITGDFDGADETGSDGIEDRNRLSRMTARQADLVAVVGVPGAWGVHHIVRTILSLSSIGVPCAKMLPTVNHAPRQPRARAGIATAIAELTKARVADADDLPSAIFVPTRKGIEATLRDGDPLPKQMVEPLASSMESLLSIAPEKVLELDTELAREPVAVVPGSLGTWQEDDDV